MNPVGTLLRIVLPLLLVADAACAPRGEEAAAESANEVGYDPGGERATARLDENPYFPLSPADPVPPEWTVISCRRSNETRRRIPRSGGELQRGIDVVRLRVPDGAYADPSVQEVTFHVIESPTAAEATIRTVPPGVRFDRPIEITMSYARCHNFSIPTGHEIGVIRFRPGGPWEPIPVLAHDTAQRALTVEVTEISRFAIATRAPE